MPVFQESAGAMLRNILFDDDGEPEEIGFRRYAQTFSQFADICRSDGPFRVRLEAAGLEPFVLYEALLSGVSLGFRATHQRLSSARGGLIVLQSGAIRWTDETGDHNASGPVILIWDMARVERATYEHAHLLYLAFDPAILDGSASSILDLHAACMDEGLQALAHGVLGAVSRHAAGGTGVESCAGIITSLLGQLIHSCPSATRQDGPVLLVDKVKALVEQDPSVRWTASALGRVLGLSRASLFRKLQPFGGVAGLVLEARVAGARKMLFGNPGTPLKDLGAAFGLGGRRRLDSAFLAVTGETASSLQERLRQSVASTYLGASLAWAELLGFRVGNANRLTD
jgi:hypothetical protein